MTIAAPDPARAVAVLTTALDFSPTSGTCVSDGVVEVEFVPSGSESSRPVALEFRDPLASIALDGVRLN